MKTEDIYKGLAELPSQTAHNTHSMLVSALRVVTLDHNIREWLEAHDPQALRQALVALVADDPSFAERIAEVRSNLAAQREEYRLARGGFYVEVDGEPWCACSSELFNKIARAGGRCACSHATRESAEAQVALIARLAPEAEARIVPGGCPARED